MEINNTGSTYGAAFRQKPIFFMSGKETVAFFEGKLKKNMTLQEDSCTLGSNDTYRRQHTTYEVSDKKKGSTFLDLDFLIKDETSSLKGNLSDKKDVDFYNFSIPFNRTIQNYFGVQIYMDMPEGCDYDLTLYDEYGNQVGKAEWDGEGRKTLTIPNWDTNTNKYCIKIENKNGEEVSPHDYYKISFKVTENKEQEKTDAIREAFGNLRGIQIARWANAVGKDEEYGGIISYADALGETPRPIDWFKETNSLWNEKVWWPNAEALTAYAQAYCYTKDSYFLQEFLDQHNYCKEKFFDSQYKEWFERLEYDGTVKNSAKGTPWKCAFHLVRALVFTLEAFSEMEAV